jgi:hypothetical protein
MRLPPAAERCALPGTDFPRRRAEPSGQSDYKSLSEGHTRADNRTTATAFQYVHNAADDAAIISSFDPAHVRRQVRFDPLPLLIAQPK